MLTEISAGLSSLLAARDIAQGLNSLDKTVDIGHVRLELIGKLIEAQDALLSAKQNASTLEGRIAELEGEIMRMKDWSAEREKYQITQIDAGAFAYMAIPGMEGSEPAHWLCAQCFDAGQKSILQSNGTEPSGRGGLNTRYRCNRCEMNISVFSGRRPETRYVAGQ